jgi:hypothetical protein
MQLRLDSIRRRPTGTTFIPEPALQMIKDRMAKREKKQDSLKKGKADFMADDEEHDRQRLIAAWNTAKRSDVSEDVQLVALLDVVEIAYKCDALAVHDEARRHTLEAFELLRAIANKNPTSPEARERQEEAGTVLAYYEERLFPGGKPKS